MEKIFPVGVPVIGKDFIGREEELKDIERLLKMGQSVILTAPRKYGKTSLLMEILNRLKKEKYLVALVDLFGVLTKKELAEKIVDVVLSNKKIKHGIKILKENLIKAMKIIELKESIQDYDFILRFADNRSDENALLDSALEFPQEFAKKANRHLILAFDEFGDLFKLNGEALLKKMRSMFQLHQDVTYIFSGSQESLMEELFSKKKSAFFRFGRIFHLTELSKQSFKSYILGKFRQQGIKIDSVIVDAILSKTNAHPYYTQLVCQLCYLNVKGEREEILMKDVIHAYQRAIFFEKSYFEELEISLMGNKYQLLLLRQILKDETSAYKISGIDKQYIYKLLISLQKKGIIKRVDKGRYTFIDPLFREYLILREEGKM